MKLKKESEGIYRMEIKESKKNLVSRKKIEKNKTRIRQNLLFLSGLLVVECIYIVLSLG